MIWACCMSMSVINFQWYFWGYSLAFSSTATNGFIGNLSAFGLKGVLGAPSPGSPLIPELLYSFYQVRSARASCAWPTANQMSSATILRDNRRHCGWCHRRARSSRARHGLHFRLGNTSVLCDCILGLGRKRLGIQMGCTRLCRWRTCRDWIRCFCIGILMGSRQTSGEDDVELPPAQCQFDHAWNRVPLVWLAWFQRRKCIRRKSSCGDGVLEQ